MSRQAGFIQEHMILINCAECGTKLGPKPKFASNHKFCSPKCKLLFRQKKHGKNIKYSVWKHYGYIDPITNNFANKETYERLLNQQKGTCAICSETEKLCLDHDHKTNIVRGLLCQKHNKALGIFGDDIIGVNNLLEYLKK